MRTSLTLLACLWHLAAPAEAQSSNPFVFNGTVKSVDASSVSLTSEESGALNTFRLGPNLLVIRNMPASLADIKPNDFIASAAVRKTDGKLYSTELRIFPEALRGLGEGQRRRSYGRQMGQNRRTLHGRSWRKSELEAGRFHQISPPRENSTWERNSTTLPIAKG